MRQVSLASGSKGNAYLVESRGALLLIDCGISYRQLVQRVRAVGFDVENIVAAVFTHEHDDHVKGVAQFAKNNPLVPLFANYMTAEAIGGEFAVFENGQRFEAGPFEISAFSIPHDVCDPVGYMIRADGATHFHATDVGAPLDSIGVHLSEADTATLESNHDPVLLSQSDRPLELKRRIRSSRGHLSNDEAADLVTRFASRRLRHLSLAHLSQQCNDPRLAWNTMREALDSSNRRNVELEVLEQDSPGRLWEC